MPYRDAMANQTPHDDYDARRRALRPLGTREFLDADRYRGFLALTSDGPNLTIPLQALYDITSVANTLHEDDDAEVVRWLWREPADPSTGRGPVLRAARLVVEELPMTVPVRRQLADGSWSTVEISPQEWAENEGRLTRGAGDVDQAVDDDQEVTRA